MKNLTPGLVGRPTAERLAGIAADVPADQAIVEIGVFMARTTTFLAAGAQSGNGAHVYGVDPWTLGCSTTATVRGNVNSAGRESNCKEAR